MVKIKAGLIQMSLKGNVESDSPNAIRKKMIDAHIELISDAAAKGVQVLGMQEFFNAPYFPASEDTSWYSTSEEIPNGPTISAICELAKQYEMVIVAPIYENNYWKRAKCDQLPSGLDLAVFDWAVNSGVSRASKALQKIIGVKDDGVIGPITVKETYKCDSEKVILNSSTSVLSSNVPSSESVGVAQLDKTGISAGKVFKVNDAGNAWELGNASSAEIYGFVKNGNNLNVTTTNGGQDSINNTTYAAFDDKIFAASGFTWTINASGNLIATI